MSNLFHLEYNAFDVFRNNYLPWILDAEIYLDSKDLEDTIETENNISQKDKDKAIFFLRRHLEV